MFDISFVALEQHQSQLARGLCEMVHTDLMNWDKIISVHCDRLFACLFRVDSTG